MIRFSIAILIVFCLSWIPLVGAFHYETAFTIALSGILLVPICCTRKRNPQETDNSKHTSLAYTLTMSVAFWGAATLVCALTAAIKQEIFCDFTSGLSFQILIALPANVLAGLTWGWARTCSKYLPVHIAIYATCVIADIGSTLLALYQWPPLIAFGQFFGFFAGSIYDEAIHITQALIHYRVGTCILCLCLAFAQTQNTKVIFKYLLLCIGLICACANHAWHAYNGQITPFGHQKLQNTLWQTVSAPDQAFHVHFIPNSRNHTEINRQRRQILLTYARDYQALEQFFNNRPPAPDGIHIWLYPNRDMKAQFIGAKNTSFARVWLNEIHLVQTTPDATLAKHEMAHLFAAQFGNGPLKLAGGWNIPALGWIEGLAMAAEWPINQKFDLHQWSAAILYGNQKFADITPHKLIYGFWGLPSRVAYTLAGSYVQYLIQNYGIDRVKTLSQSMPGDFEDIIGVTFNEAFQAWKTWLKMHHTNPKTHHTAELVFGSASIWNKKCARANAAKKAKFYQCLGDMACSDLKSVTLTTCDSEHPQSCSQTPQNTLDLEQIWSLYHALGALETSPVPKIIVTLANTPQTAVFKPAWTRVFNAYGYHADTFAQDPCVTQTLDLTQTAPLSNTLRWFLAQNIKLHASKGSKAVQYQWLERLGDIFWHGEQYALANVVYQILRKQYLPETTARRLDIKLQAVQYPHTPAEYAVKHWFASNSNAELQALRQAYGQIPVIAYLAFVHDIHKNDVRQARNALMNMLMFSQNATQGSQLSPKVWAETLRLMPLTAQF